MNKPEMMLALHPDPNKQGTRVTKATYETYKAALLKVIPDTDEGIAFMTLSKAIIPYLPQELVKNTSPGWWTTTVKLDLEARGLIERTNAPGRQHLRRCN